MKKVFKLEDLDCAACGAKMEDAIRKLDGVTSVSVNFMLQHLTLEAPDEIFDAKVKEAAKACKRVELDCRIIM